MSARAFEFKLDEERCNGCGNCVIVCPLNASLSPEAGTGFGPRAEAVLKIEGGKAVLTEPELCNGCGACVLACPTGAIEIVPTKLVPAEVVKTVGAAAIPAGEVEGVAKPIKAEEVAVRTEAVERARRALDAIAESLGRTDVRFLIELGEVERARERIRRKSAQLRQ